MFLSGERKGFKPNKEKKSLNIERKMFF